MLKQTVGTLISRAVIGVSPEAPVTEALALMQRHSISCVVVLEEDVPVGILTERGLVRHMANNGRTLAGKAMREIMTAPVTTVGTSAYVYEALQILISKNIRHLVVVDDHGRGAGVLTLSNLVEGVGSDLLVEFQPVERHMSRVVVGTEEDLDLRSVLRTMAEKSISCMLHTKGGRPDGLVTERDVVRLAARGEALDEITITRVMSAPVVTVPASAPVHEVARLMRSNAIRRVVVTEPDGSVAGLATQSNIIRSLESNYIKVLKQVITEKEDRLQDTAGRLDKVSLYLDSILNTSIDMAIVATDENYRIIFYNACAEDILKLPKDQAMGHHVTDLHHEVGVEPSELESIMAKTRAEGCHSFTYEREVDGEERYYQARLAAILDNERRIEGYVFMVRDITERRRAEENIRYMAYHDILTGLPNRVSFDERLHLELAHAERNQTRLAVFVMDLDKFKEVNDTMGHFAGDVLLEEVADRLAGSLRKSDTVARVGGDEFMMVLPTVTSDDDALRAAAKMAEALAEPVEVKGRPWKVDLSVGVSFFPDHATQPKRLVELADEAMYQAKGEGRARGGSNICLYGEAGATCTNFGG